MRGIHDVVRAVLERGETRLDELVSSRVARDIIEALGREGYAIEPADDPLF